MKAQATIRQLEMSQSLAKVYLRLHRLHFKSVPEKLCFSTLAWDAVTSYCSRTNSIDNS